MTGLGDIGRIDGDGFSFAYEMLADDRGVERKPVEKFHSQKGYGMSVPKNIQYLPIGGNLYDPGWP